MSDKVIYAVASQEIICISTAQLKTFVGSLNYRHFDTMKKGGIFESSAYIRVETCQWKTCPEYDSIKKQAKHKFFGTSFLGNTGNSMSLQGNRMV